MEWEYDKRKIVPEKLYVKFYGETSSRPFSKKYNLSISLDQQSKIYAVCFDCLSKSRTATKLY